MSDFGFIFAFIPAVGSAFRFPVSRRRLGEIVVAFSAAQSAVLFGAYFFGLFLSVSMARLVAGLPVSAAGVSEFLALILIALPLVPLVKSFLIGGGHLRLNLSGLLFAGVASCEIYLGFEDLALAHPSAALAFSVAATLATGAVYRWVILRHYRSCSLLRKVSLVGLIGA
jgi:hypothetical protein